MCLDHKHQPAKEKQPSFAVQKIVGHSLWHVDEQLVQEIKDRLSQQGIVMNVESEARIALDPPSNPVYCSGLPSRAQLLELPFE